MIGRQERTDQIEDRMDDIRQRWSSFENWGISLTESVMQGLDRSWTWAKGRPLVLRWTIVFASAFMSIAIGLSLQSAVGTSSQLLLLLPAVLVSALYGGVFAGTIASLLGGVAAVHWKMGVGPAPLVTEVVALTLYALACCIILGLSRAQENQRQEILKFAETLEDKVGERTADLENANKELLDFCYSISHDLRAPMRNIVGSSRILLEDASDQLDGTSRQRLQSLANSANKLSSWVDDLLNYAKLGHMELKPEWVNVTLMADELCAQFREEQWEYSSLTVRIHPNIVTTGDRVLVRMALRCILENACKYAKKGQPLVIEIGERRSRKGTYVSIRDNGIGFEQQYGKKIFEPFQRLHRDTEYIGSGIGLANVKRIVERHGGDVMAEGVPGIGATFLLRFGSGAKSDAKAKFADEE